MNQYANVTAALVLVVAASPCLGSVHTGYWNQRTDKGESFDCQGITSKDTLISYLKRVGWNTDPGIPKVNWERDDVVIVAPSKFYKSGNLAFFGLELEGNTLVLKYGWKRIQASESIGAGTASFGSVGEGYPATIVIAYNRAIESGRGFSCRNMGLVD